MLSARRDALSGQSFGRRAAGGGDRPRADDQSAPDPARRGLARTGAGGHRATLSIVAVAARRAERRSFWSSRSSARALSVATRVMCMLEGRIVLDGPAAAMTRDQIVDAYFGLQPRRRASREAGMSLVNLIVQGRPARRLLRAARLRPVADVRRDAHHQSRPRRPRRSSPRFLVFSISDAFDISPFLALARRAADHGSRLGWLLQRGILERSLRAGMLVPLLATFGLSIALENMLFEVYGRRHALARRHDRRPCFRQPRSHRPALPQLSCGC